MCLLLEPRSTDLIVKKDYRTTAHFSSTYTTGACISLKDMAATDQSLSVPQTYNSESDPCSLTYQRHYQKPDGISRSTSVRSKNGHVRNVKKNHSKNRRFLSSIKKMFRSKPKPDFVMVDGHKPPMSSSRSSMRSHRSTATRMTNKRTSTPAVLVRGPIVKAREPSYRVHSFDGESSSPTEPSKRDSVRFSHPAVQNVIVPPVPTTASDVESVRPDVTDRSSNRTSGTSNAQTNSSEYDSSAPTPIRPKTIWRNSNQFNAQNGSVTDFEDFKARLDGHKVRSEATSAPYQQQNAESPPPSLQFIPRMADIILDEPTLQIPPSGNVPIYIQKNRDEALRLLETGGVLAVMPKDDVPNSAVPVLSKQYPAALTPKQYPQALVPGTTSADQPKVRPVSLPAALHPKPEFQAFNPQDFARFNPEVEYGYDPSAPSSESSEGKATAQGITRKPLGVSRAKTPDSFATNGQLRNHYSRVESGVFDAPVMPVPRPVNPTPPSEFSRNSRGASQDIGRTFLEPPTPAPMPSAQPPVQEIKMTREELTHHKSASSANVKQKPLPPTPAVRAEAFAKDNFPIPHKMNDNGFPVASLRDVKKTYSTEPKYQRRSINDVEAKYRRETGLTKVAKPVKDKKVAKLEKEKAKLEKKIVKEQGKQAKKEQKQAKAKALDPDLLKKQKQIDDGVKKLMNM